MARKLSERETAVLRIIEREAVATGPEIARIMNEDPAHVWDASPAGAHQTAASLVRKNLAWRAGTSKLQWYKITQTGRNALAGDQSEKWVAR